MALLTSLMLSAQADPLDQWSWRLPRPITTTLDGIVYGIVLFVAVGNNGWPSSIITSPDGEKWSAESAGTDRTLFGVAYGIGRFIAVGEAGTILTSTDGHAWSSQSSGVTNNLSAVCYGGASFVVVGTGGVVLSSPDGSRWQTTQSVTPENLNTVAFGNGRFVAAGAYKTVQTSADGVKWTLSEVEHNDPYFQLTDIAFGSGVFVGVGSESANAWSILVSTDGVSWSPAIREHPCSFVYGVAFGDGKFVTVPNYGTGSEISSDGTNWICDGDTLTTRPLYRVAYG